MKDGFVKIACATPMIKVADCTHNSKQICSMIADAHSMGASIIAFPELTITGYTCGDLFLQQKLISSALDSLLLISSETASLDIITIVGLPFQHGPKLYNCAAVIYKGNILGFVPKSNIPNYSEFYEARHFAKGFADSYTTINNKKIPFGNNLIFSCSNMPSFCFGIEICEDLWVADTPSVKLAQNGAALIFNISASDEIIGKSEYRKTIIKAKSGSLLCAYAYSDAGTGESTTDMVFAGHNIIAENGSVIAESEKFTSGIIYADVDFNRIQLERIKSTTFAYKNSICLEIAFNMPIKNTNLIRHFSPTPFIPSSNSDLQERCHEIHNIQAVGLMSRLKHIGCKNVVLGLSGGLDSTLALIVAIHAFDMLSLDKKGIKAVTMPCFGTTNRTYQNACRLAAEYGVELIEINIKNSVLQHFNDINHDPNIHDLTYENSQARERTQILMDLANKFNGIVIGTGDLSELALGWATYNGDHMSMYAVNASIPKTLVRYLINYEANNSNKSLCSILTDIINTPVSPELLPPDSQGLIQQKTEDIVGPYELHDFFLYYLVRFGFTPSKIYRMAVHAFNETYNSQTILKWLNVFYKRFFAQQFKRSCLPDGPKVGSVTLSPRGDFRMPSDASASEWLNELDSITVL